MQRDAISVQQSTYIRSSDPNWRTSKMGYVFDSNSDIWQLSGSITVNLGRLKDLDDATRTGFRKSLCRYAEELSDGTVDAMLGYTNMFLAATGARCFSVLGLTNWRSTLDTQNEYRLGALKAFLIAWNEWEYPGIGDDVVEYLDELKLKGNVKGKAVRQSCPYSGPITLLEQGALLDWASNSFLENFISLTEYSFFLTLIFTGRRSIQIRSLRACDLTFREDNKGHDYIVKFPRAKQRKSGFRGAFRPLSVTEDLFLLLKNQATESQEYVEAALGQKLPPEVRLQIPVFLANDRVDGIQDIDRLVSFLEETPDFLHMTKSDALEVVRQVSVKNTARSERTGDFINFTARRFRYTKGTNLARRGITGVALAMALDHTDTQNIDVYTENTEEMAEQIDAIMAPILAPLAQAFVGKLIDSERDALRAHDPHSRVKNDHSHSVGNCGTFAFCASGYRACYTCPNFQPWRDGPHEEVREAVLNERKLQEEMGVSPNVIQSTDRLLLAVEQVILLCKRPKLLVQRETEIV